MTRPPLAAPPSGHRNEPAVYIGFGTILLIILVVLAFKLLRRA
jgi:hypothetical protein